MAMPFPESYAGLLHAQILSSGGLISHFNNAVDIPSGSRVGALTCSVLTASTPSTVVEGTPVSGSTATVQVDLTFVPEQVTHSLLPSQTASYYAQLGNLQRIAENHTDALAYAAENACIVDMVAATPGLSVNLPAGDMNFNTDGSVTANNAALDVMTQLVSFLFSSRARSAPSDFAIVMNYLAFGHFVRLRSTDFMPARLNELTGQYTFMGIPLFSTLYSTNFGVASQPAAFIFHKDAQACVFTDLGVAGGGPMLHNDMVTKWTTVGTYGHGTVIAGLIGEAKNQAS